MQDTIIRHIVLTMLGVGALLCAQAGFAKEESFPIDLIGVDVKTIEEPKNPIATIVVEIPDGAKDSLTRKMLLDSFMPLVEAGRDNMTKLINNADKELLAGAETEKVISKLNADLNKIVTDVNTASQNNIKKVWSDLQKQDRALIAFKIGVSAKVGLSTFVIAVNIAEILSGDGKVSKENVEGTDEEYKNIRHQLDKLFDGERTYREEVMKGIKAIKQGVEKNKKSAIKDILKAIKEESKSLEKTLETYRLKLTKIRQDAQSMSQKLDKAQAQASAPKADVAKLTAKIKELEAKIQGNMARLEGGEELVKSTKNLIAETKTTSTTADNLLKLATDAYAVAEKIPDGKK